MSTSSVSRSEFFDLRSLNNLVSHLLMLSKQNVLRTYGVSMRFSQPWRNKFHQFFYTVCIFFRQISRNLSPWRWSSNTFDMALNLLALQPVLVWRIKAFGTCLVPFRNMCTLPRLIQTLCLQLGVFSRYDKLDIRWYKFTRCKMDLDDYKQWIAVKWWGSVKTCS